MKQKTKVDTKKKVIALYEIAYNASDFISLIQTAFIYNTPRPLQDYKAQAKSSREGAERISKIITAYAVDDPELKPYVSVPAHIISIWKSLERLSELTLRKNDKKILFSDKAADETVYLLQRLIEILRPTADIILARNMFLGKYVVQSQAGVEKSAEEYATLYEDRLITGEGLNEAAPIFVKMLDAIKDIAWNAKKIAVTLAG